MIKPDVLTCWPKGHDYPLWRQQICRYRESFDRVIIVFTDDNLPYDLREFVRGSLPDVTFLDVEFEPNGVNWYHYALTRAVASSTADWLWFTEQDFLYCEEFLRELLIRATDYDAVFIEQPAPVPRAEPGCFLVRRETLYRTSRYFGDDHGTWDNFDIFSAEVRTLGRCATVQSLGLGRWHHLNGVTSNYHILDSEQDGGIYRPEELRLYNKFCQRVQPQHPDWVGVMERVEVRLS